MRLAGLEHEEFHAMCVDTRHRIIALEPMARVTIDGAEIHRREIVKAALAQNAAAVILIRPRTRSRPLPTAPSPPA